MYSTSTQKQSFDSMTLSQTHFVKISAHGHLRTPHNCSEPIYKNLPSEKDTSDGGTLLLKTMKCSRDPVERHIFREVYPHKEIANSFMETGDDENAHQTSIGPNVTPPLVSECINVKYKRKEEIKISIGPRSNLTEGQSSGVVTFFRRIFNWRSSSRKTGYYSPSIDQSINDRGICVASRAFENKFDKVSLDDGDISNSSLKDVDAAALKDELSAYMEELRLREKKERI